MADNSERRPDLTRLNLDHQTMRALTRSGMGEVLRRFAGDTAIMDTLRELLAVKTEYDRSLALVKAQMAAGGSLDVAQLPAGAIVEVRLGGRSNLVAHNSRGEAAGRWMSMRTLGDGTLKIIGDSVKPLSLKPPREPFNVNDAVKLGSVVRDPKGKPVFDPHIRLDETVVVHRGDNRAVVISARHRLSRVPLPLDSIKIDDQEIASVFDDDEDRRND